jgi:hypothetical protein
MKKNLMVVTFLIGTLLAASNVCSKIKDLGTVSRVYSIAEKDCLNEIREKAKKLDWDKIRKESIEKAKKTSLKTSFNFPKQPKTKPF